MGARDEREREGEDVRDRERENECKRERGDMQKHVREHERERLASAREDRQKAGRRAGGRGRDMCGMCMWIVMVMQRCRGCKADRNPRRRTWTGIGDEGGGMGAVRREGSCDVDVRVLVRVRVHVHVVRVDVGTSVNVNVDMG